MDLKYSVTGERQTTQKANGNVMEHQHDFIPRRSCATKLVTVLKLHGAQFLSVFTLRPHSVIQYHVFRNTCMNSAFTFQHSMSLNVGVKYSAHVGTK